MTAEDEIAALRAENTVVREQVRALLAEVQDLRGRLAKDSHNSSKPPSSDGLGRTTKSLRKPSGKKPGGQPGHPGHRVQLAQTPDAVVRHRPQQCSLCQRALPDDAPEWIERRQVHDLPPGRLTITEHRLCHVRCATWGATTATAAPAGVSAPREYSPRLRAVASYLIEQQYVPYARTRELLAELFGVTLSVGTLVRVVRQGAEQLQPDAIKAALREAAVMPLRSCLYAIPAA